MITDILRSNMGETDAISPASKDATVGQRLTDIASQLRAAKGEFPGEIEGPDRQLYRQLEIPDIGIKLIELEQNESMILIGETLGHTGEDNSLVVVHLGPVVELGYLEVSPGSYSYVSSPETGFRQWSASYDIQADVPGIQHQYPGVVRMRGSGVPHRPGTINDFVMGSMDIVIDLLPIPPSHFEALKMLYGEGGRYHGSSQSPINNPGFFPSAQLLGEDSIREDPAARAKTGAHSLFDEGLNAIYVLK